MLRYELRKKKKEIWVVIIGIALLLVPFFVMRYMTGSVVNIVKLINRNVVIRDFLCLEQGIRNITYKDVLFAAVVFYQVILMVYLIKEMAYNISRERQLGTIVYFASQPVSMVKWLLLKLAMSVGAFVIQWLVWWFVIWRISLTGTKGFEILEDRVEGDVNAVMIALLFAGIFWICIGFFYGCVALQDSKSHINKFAIVFVMFNVFISLLPNILNIVVGILERKKHINAVIEMLYKILKALRLAAPLYWCNIYNIVKQGNLFWVFLGSIVAGCIAVIGGMRYFKRRYIG
ncbi:MAG: hypothetical protein E7270_03935 [Lachnospiraceae bacterium]|nr:hypothetical protein [Lachnospiraceae bacterium]